MGFFMITEEIEQNVKTAITDEEILKRIKLVSIDFKGQIDDLYTIVGMLVVGRLFGWRVIRLVSRRSHWALLNKLFGDPKLLMDTKGALYHKSVGMRFVDSAGFYWDYVKGYKPISVNERRFVE